MFERKKIRSAFRAVRDEFDEHLDAINANTQELLENRAMILELQERLCKLSDQIASLKLLAEDIDPDTQFCDDIDLSLREQEVFLVMYTAPDLLTTADIARALTFPVMLVHEIIEGMVLKGVPILRQRNDRGDVFLSLDSAFKEAQSKQNILRIDREVSKQFSRDLQLSLFD